MAALGTQPLLASPSFLKNVPVPADRFLMSRRRSESPALLVAQLGLVIVLGLMVSPVLRGAFPIIMFFALVGGFVMLGVRLISAPNRSGVSPFAGVPASRPLPALCPTTGTDASTARGRQPDSAVTALDRVRTLDWFQFEKLVAALFSECGFAVQRFGGANPDGGIDLIVTFDHKTSGVQCKHWKAWPVGVKEIREFIGALKDRGLERGIFVTLQRYSPDAQALAGRHQIELAGELEFTRMLEAARCEQNPSLLAILNDTQKVCPKCESAMVVRTARFSGRKFWGCSTFPRCRFRFDIAE